MGFFDNVQIDHNAKQDEDRMGYEPIESGIYKAIIEMANGVVSAGGARGLRLVFKLNVNGKERTLTETLWFTTKDGKTFTIDKKTGERRMLGGYNHAQALATLLCNKDFMQLPMEERLIKIKDEPEKVPVFTGLLNKQVALAVLKVKENARAQVNGTYENTNEVRYTNSIDKIFDEKGFTHKERKDGAEEPTFAKQWKERWTGKEKDNYKEVKETASNAQGEAIDFG